MSIKKVGSIEVYELDENLDKYTRKEREEYINELFKQEYQGKEISYLLNGEEIKALINQKLEGILGHISIQENMKQKSHIMLDKILPLVVIILI